MTNAHPKQFNHYVDNGCFFHVKGKQVGAVALCGYTWQPTGHDPRKALCPACERIAFRA